MSVAETGSMGASGVTTLRPFTYEASDSLVDVLDQIRGSLLISSYQAGRLVSVGVSGVLNVTLHYYDHAMGLAVVQDRIAVGAGPQLWFLQSLPLIAPPTEPRRASTIAASRRVPRTLRARSTPTSLPSRAQQLWFVNTLFSCLCPFNRH